MQPVALPLGHAALVILVTKRASQPTNTAPQTYLPFSINLARVAVAARQRFRTRRSRAVPPAHSPTERYTTGAPQKCSSEQGNRGGADPRHDGGLPGGLQEHSGASSLRRRTTRARNRTQEGLSWFTDIRRTEAAFNVWPACSSKFHHCPCERSLPKGFTDYRSYCLPVRARDKSNIGRS